MQNEMTCPVFWVTRQVYYYTGENVVEVSQGWDMDCVGPDMLTEQFPGEGQRYLGACLALGAALEIASMWQASEDEPVTIGFGNTWGGSLPLEPIDVQDQHTVAQLMEQAQRFDESLLRCECCGEILDRNHYYDPFNERPFCSEYCIDRYNECFTKEG
jgi:hypothetical protein